jgi:hypothetical protein
LPTALRRHDPQGDNLMRKWTHLLPALALALGSNLAAAQTVTIK